MPEKYTPDIQDRKEAALKRLNRNGGAYKHHKPQYDMTSVRTETLGQRKEAVLDRLDKSGVSSPESRRKGTLLPAVAVTGALLLPGAIEVTSGALNALGDKVEQSYDNHNLPPTGEPMEYRGGTAYQPGTDIEVEVPQTPSQP